MAGNSGGPWGGDGRGPGGNGGGNGDDRRPGRRPSQDRPQIPEIEQIVKKGQEQLRVLMGGRGGHRGGGSSGNGGGDGPRLTRSTAIGGVLVAMVVYFFASFYTVQPDEEGVELLLGKYYRTTQDGPHFAWWPFITSEVIPVSRQRSEDIGTGRPGSGEDGLMLTTDENIVDIDFRVVWNISDPAKYLFNLRDGKETVRAVSESAMREIVAGSELAPLLNRDRRITADRAKELIQQILDRYASGINIVLVNLNKADPPAEVIDAFRDVQAAEQERSRLERQADAYANRVTAEARGQAAQIQEEAEAYRAQVVNEAKGEASRFSAVLDAYQKAPVVTRKRLYLETVEKVLGGVNKVILDDKATTGGGQGVVPYLPLNELRPTPAAPTAPAPKTGGN